MQLHHFSQFFSLLQLLPSSFPPTPSPSMLFTLKLTALFSWLLLVTYVEGCTHKYMCVCINTYIYKNTYVYTYTHSLVSPFSVACVYDFKLTIFNWITTYRGRPSFLGKANSFSLLSLVIYSFMYRGETFIMISLSQNIMTALIPDIIANKYSGTEEFSCAVIKRVSL